MKTEVSWFSDRFVYCNTDLMPFLRMGRGAQLSSWLQKVDRHGLREEAVLISHLPAITVTEAPARTHSNRRLRGLPRTTLTLFMESQPNLKSWLSPTLCPCDKRQCQDYQTCTRGCRKYTAHNKGKHIFQCTVLLCSAAILS